MNALSIAANFGKLAIRQITGQLSPVLNEYQQLWKTAVMRPEYIFITDKLIDKFVPYERRYIAVANALENGMPYWFVMFCHIMEAGAKQNPFQFHLHCGDSLTGRTVNVPKGRPIENPNGGTKPPSINNPYSWEESALDAMNYMKYDRQKDWSIANIFYLLEKYNGFGYRYRKINSPYLWSYTNHYGEKPHIGKFVTDGKFDAKAISKQAGTAAILLRMKAKGILNL